MKVENIVVKGNVQIVPLTPINHIMFKREYGFDFPSVELLELSYKTNFYILTNPVSVRVKTDKEWMVFDFKAGFVWDLASVPAIFKPLVDDNDQTALVASMVHDFLFSTHRKTFHEANEIFREIIKDQGGSKLKAFIYWLGVSSPVGKILYRRSTPKRSWHDKWVDYKVNNTGE